MYGFILFNILCLIFNYLNAFWFPDQVNQQPEESYKNVNFDFGCECGKKNIVLASRIIGGEEVAENEYPWMAAVISINNTRVTCGASIINDRYVITAAHCLQQSFGKENMKIAVGAHNSCKWDRTTSIFSVENIFPHPRYHPKDPSNYADIMLVILAMRISFDKFVRPICLPPLGLDAASRFGGQSVSAIGWGLSENDALFNGECGLRTVDLTLFKKSECPSDVSGMICAGSKETSRGTCSGDSGGPLQIVNDESKYVLIGITSNGWGCAQINSPDRYTDVANMLPWILEVTKHDSTYCWR